MRMYDIIQKKRDGGKLSHEEMKFFIKGVTDGSIPDYQISAMLMAIFFRQLDAQETADMTDLMAKSGDMADLSSISGFKVDKHSTGGVGDKTTLIIAPTVASCGVKVAKMSGRGLGHTGGTIDKLESIPGFMTDISTKNFFDIVNRVGVAVIGQSADFAPADKKLYALRDVTATVDNIPLIAASVMSKKIASGSDGIVLDVTTGSGAFMKTRDEAVELAGVMVDIGEKVGRKVAALITDMDTPLGCAIGNSLEVIEAIDTLKGKGPADLEYVCRELAANMLLLAGKGDIDICRELVDEAISSGRAFETFCQMVTAQGGDGKYIRDTSLFEKAKICYQVKSRESGYITAIQTAEIGMASMMLGAGRETKESIIDFSAGIKLYKKTGDKVEKGDIIAELFTNRDTAETAAERLLNAVTIGEKAAAERPLVMARVTTDGVEYFD